MLAYFPKSYESEILYSLIARYGIHTGTEVQKEIISDLFGVKTAAAIIDFPSHLRELSTRVKDVWSITPQEIIQNHTLLPAYLPFITPEHAEQAIESSMSNYGANIHTRIGISASSVTLPEYLRLCPLCIKEQKINLGETYWRREHQLPGVYFCSVHHCVLHHSDQHYRPDGKHQFYAANYSQLVDKMIDIKTKNKSYHKLYTISVQFKQLLEYSINIRLTTWQWTVFYQQMASEIGLMTGKRINHSGIHELIQDNWSNNCLKLLQCSISSDSDNDWLVNIFRKHRKSFHPLRHLTVLQTIRPNQSIIALLEEVQQLPKSKVMTIVNAKKDSSISKKIINEHRRQWLTLKDNFPEHGTKNLRQLEHGAALYTWLYRHDNQWLKQNCPQRKSYRGENYRVDWDTRDTKIHQQLENIKKENIDNENSPRKTQTWFIHQLKQRAMVEKHLADLPKCKAFLDINAETISDYQQRRIYRVVKELIEEGKPVKIWMIIRRAGLKSEKLTKKVRDTLKNVEGIDVDGLPNLF
ncbi:MAG: TnsD family transposase [Gammaproteobacteria bacterium]|nr:TnsD family transposase [Gammaproteobacteria bacterium]